MRYRILKDGEELNTIIADEAFVNSYCEKHGYTYEELPEPEPVEPEEPEIVTEPEPTTEEILDAMLGV